MEADQFQLRTLTEKIIGCAYEVSNQLGAGFVEKVYENALTFELKQAGLDVRQQQGMTVSYKGAAVGEYISDMLVEGNVLVELKAVKALD